MSDNGGPSLCWQSATTQTSAVYTGLDGHTYGFYSVATDNVDNVQPTPAAPRPRRKWMPRLPTSGVRRCRLQPRQFHRAVVRPGHLGGSGLASYDVYVSDNGGSFTLWQPATTATSATFTGVDGHSYGFYSIALDNAGNSQATPGRAQANTFVSIADRLALHPPVQAVAGGKSTITVDAVDATGVTDPYFSGLASVVLLTGPTGGRVVGTLTAPIVNGVATFTVTPSVAGTYTLLAASSTDLLAGTGTLTVVPAPTLKITLSPTSAASGTTFTATIQALLKGKPDTAYAGSVTLTSSDPQSMPVTGTFQAGGNATITLPIVLRTFGKQTVTVADASLPRDRGPPPPPSVDQHSPSITSSSPECRPPPSSVPVTP